jgi:hypothetical protein
MAHARMEVTQPRHPLVVALVGGVVIVLGARNGTASRPELWAVAPMNGLLDFFCDPAGRSVEAS